MVKFKKVKRLGAGGFGEVWTCVRVHDSHEFAMKILSENNPEARERFEKEIRLLRHLSHPNVIRVEALGLNSNPPWYVMPLYAGSLLDEFPQITGDVKRISSVFGAVLRGVEYAHSQGVIHRDLKPDNVLLNDDQDVVVTDFGLGRLQTAVSTRMTRTGEAMGSILYMPPEQLVDAKSADVRSDVYSLGRMLYALFDSQMTTSVQDLERLPAGFAAIIRKATRSDRAERYQTVTEMLADFVMTIDLLLTEESEKTLESVVNAVLARANNSDLTDFASRLDNLIRDKDRLHEMVMSMSGAILKKIEVYSSDVARRLIESFSAHVTGQSWPYDYTDKIGATCERLFAESKNTDVRTALLYTALEVGASHNRWYVMTVFGDLLAQLRDGSEAAAVRIALRSHRDMLKKVQAYVRPERLKHKLNELFE